MQKTGRSGKVRVGHRREVVKWEKKSSVSSEGRKTTMEASRTLQVTKSHGHRKQAFRSMLLTRK